MDLSIIKSDGINYSSAIPLGSSNQVSPLEKLPDCDLITFIAVAQSVDVFFIDIEWHQGLGFAGEGASASIQQSLANSSTTLAFKQLKDGQNESWAYKTALSEILILQHSLIRREENIIDLHGVGWNVRKDDNGNYQLNPVLVYENASEFGNLYDFMINDRPTIQKVTGKSAPRHQLYGSYGFEKRLGLCIGIGKAIQVMHSCNIIHGDLKPHNILIFSREDERRIVPKVIDFGYSMYGFGNDDLVKLGGTKEWRAPEWHHRRFRIQDARKTDVYSFTKVCEWLLNFDLGHDNVGVWPKRHVQPHMEQFYRLGLCDDPHERTDSMPLLLLVLSNAMRAQSESLFEDLYRINPIGFTKLLRDKHGSDQATTIVESIDSNRQERFSGARDLESRPNDILGLLERELPQIPNISKDFSDFQGIHFLIRVRMQEGLLQRSCEEGQPQEQFKDIAFQLALCYELAFGVQRDVDKSQKWLTLSGRGALHVSAELNKLHSNNQSRSEVQGLINDSRVVNITDRYATAGQLGDALPLYTIESEGKLASLGPLADPTLVLQSYLTELLQLDGQRSKAKTLLQQTLNACDREWGSDSTWSSSLRLQLSRIMAAQGDMLGAISLAEGLLQLRTNADNNVDILQALSSYYGLICDYGRSVQYSDQAWQIRKGQFGETHPLTMNALELLSYATTNTNMTEAEIMESEVLDWRRKVLGEHSDVVLQTMKNLAFVRANTRGKELEGIEMQQEILLKLKEVPEPSWTQIVWGTDRLAWMQLKANQLEEAIKTRSQLLGQKDDLLSCQQGLALLGNHAKNLKDAGRIREAEDLRADVLEKIPIILKPIPNISNPIIRGVGCAFQVSAEFDDEATTLYVRNVRLWKHLSRELGEFHERTVSILRFLLLLSNEAHIVQATVHFLGLQHPTTQLAVVRLKNKLSEYVRNVVQIEDCVSETMDWMQTRIALLE